MSVIIILNDVIVSRTFYKHLSVINQQVIIGNLLDRRHCRTLVVSVSSEDEVANKHKLCYYRHINIKQKLQPVHELLKR